MLSDDKTLIVLGGYGNHGFKSDAVSIDLDKMEATTLSKSVKGFCTQGPSILYKNQVISLVFDTKSAIEMLSFDLATNEFSWLKDYSTR